VPEVTCPSCHTRQAIDPDVSGYTCQSCGADWDFVTCVSCGGRFHAAPDATGWRCPTCGTENVRPHAPQPTTVGVEDLPLGPNRLMVIGAVGIVLLALIVWGLTRGDDEPASAPTTSPSATAAAGSASEALCTHLIDIQSLRFEALGEVASTLQDDAAAIEAEGDAQLARDVQRLAREVAALQAALETPEIEDDDVATQAVIRALEPIPC
jgi:predicted RNA-binding Zn-ribbon protein involved in translation (DUF1610 family)